MKCKTRELLPHWSIGKLINNILETEIVFVVNGGPHPSGQAFGSADYKGSKTLKSCHKEFHLNSTDAASYKKQIGKNSSFCDLLFFFIMIKHTHMKRHLELFLVFLKIGAFTFGGGYAMIPLIRNEVVKKKKWLEDDEFMDMLAIAQSIPGPMALNAALFVGNKRLGFKGSLFSGLGVILPSFIIILFIAVIFTQFKDNPVIERIFKGIRPAVVALIAGPLTTLGKAAGITRKNALIPIIVIIAVWLLKISPVYIVIIAILIGIIHLAYLKQKLKR